jgi:hypothetical protein
MISELLSEGNLQGFATVVVVNEIGKEWAILMQ